MPANDFKVGIVGTGWIAEKGAITLNAMPGFRCYAVASRTQEKADAFAARWGVEKAFMANRNQAQAIVDLSRRKKVFLADVGPYDFRGGLIGDKAVTVLFDNSKLKRAVPGFQATVRFEEGVAQTLDHILSHPELQVQDPAFDAWCDRVLAAVDNAKASCAQ